MTWRCSRRWDTCPGIEKLFHAPLRKKNGGNTIHPTEILSKDYLT
jgi:hypothetical protein